MDNKNFNNGENNFDNNGYNYGNDANQTASNDYSFGNDANQTAANDYTYNQGSVENNNAYTATPVVETKSGIGKTFSIVSLICGIATIILSCIPCVCLLCLLIGPAAVVFGILGLKKEGGSKGMCIAGIICGSVGFLIYLASAVINVAISSTGIFDEILSSF